MPAVTRQALSVPLNLHIFALVISRRGVFGLGAVLTRVWGWCRWGGVGMAWGPAGAGHDGGDGGDGGDGQLQGLHTTLGSSL